MTDSTDRTIKVENIQISSTQIFFCLNRASQKLVPCREFSHVVPHKFVPANHKKSLIRKIKLPQNFSPTRYSPEIQHGRRVRKV